VVTSVFTYQGGWFRSEKSVVAGIPAYLASAASTASLQNTIFDSVRPSEDEVLDVYLSKWQSIPCVVLPSEPLPTKQSFYDSPGITQTRQQVEESKSDATRKAQFLAASVPHSGDWLLALPVASRGIKLDDEAVRVAVALRLGLNLGAPHTCRCAQIPWRSGKLLVWDMRVVLRRCRSSRTRRGGGNGCHQEMAEAL